jgi:2-oxoglutarate/2-oxoacid ferredoxin oxidoreductase subunit beta
MNIAVTPQGLTAQNFASGQEVRWCLGCGNYSIIKTVRLALAQTGATPENTVFVSGIGCSSRFPYYVETYGYHTIHGRAAAVATGVKLANPELEVWIVTGDGDGLSIGGNHTAHLLRRNLDCQLLLFNNEIYGLTKGQASPTTKQGKRTVSTPYGSLERPVNPTSFALGAGGRFVARCIDVVQKELLSILKRAKANKGTSFVEIYQNCVVFNDGAFEDFAAKKVQAESVIWLEHGQPMLFSKGTKGLKFNPESFRLEVAGVVDGDWKAAGILVHDETNRPMAQMLIDMPAPAYPIALGVIYCSPLPAYDALLTEQNQKVAATRKRDLQALLGKSETWSVGENGESAGA